MVMRLMDGFEESVLNPYRWPTNGGVAVGAPYGRLGGSGARVGDNVSGYFGRPIVINDATLIYAFAMQTIDTNAGQRYCSNAFGPGGHIYLGPGQDGTIIGLLNVNGTSGDYYTPAGSIQPGVWHRIILAVTFDNTAGTVGIWVDGIQVVNETALDTNPPPASTSPQFGGTSPTDVDQWNIDDLMILDGAGTINNAPPPDARVFTSLPDGNGATSGLTGSDGNQIDNYLQVDDDPVVLTAWNGSATDAALDTYAMEDTVLVGDVLALQLESITQKDDAGTKFGKNVLRSGGTNYIDSSFGLVTAPSWGYNLTMHDVDPDTGIAWTEAGADAAEAGFQVSDT